MFREDVKRIKICIEQYSDYYSALEYATLVKGQYKGEEKVYLETIIKSIKKGEEINLEKKKSS